MAICSGIELTHPSEPRITANFVSGDVRGDSESNAYRWTDIYDTAIDGGWTNPTSGNPLVRKIGDVFIVEAAIYIEGVDTYFVDSGKSIYWQGGLSNYLKILNAVNDANIKLTECILSRNEIHRLAINFTDSINIELDRIIFNNIWLLQLKNNILNECISVNSDFEDYGNNIINNFACHNSYRIYGDSSVNTVILTNGGLYFRTSNSVTINNVNIDSDSSDFLFRNYGTTDNTYKVIDSIADIDSYAFIRISEGHFTLQLQTDLKIALQNAANAAATLYDQHGNEIISGTLDADGRWDLADPVTYVQREIETADGAVVKNEKTTFEPFTLEVTKPGKQKLTIPNIYATIDGVGTLSPTVVEGQMREPVYVDRQIVGTIEKTKELSGSIEVIELTGDVS